VRSSAAALSVVLLLSGTAAAQTSSAGASSPSAPASLEASAEAKAADESSKARARTLYERGARAYADGKYYEAADLFLEANRVYPSAELVFNVAKAYDKLGNQSGALAFYRDYSRRAGSAADEMVAPRTRELEQALAARGVQQLSVISDPESALLLIDGKPVGVTPWTGETWPGRHHVVLRLSGHRAFETLFDVAAHHAEDLTVKLTALPPPEPPKASAESSAPRVETPFVSTLTWLALGVGTAALGAALIVEMANDDRAGLSRTGAFFGGAGAAACALGGVLLYVDLNPPSPSRRGSAAPAMAGLRWRTSF
jgi:tetratricopeptide (TPR) repeat protein